jgi:hypothetical protein
MRETEKSGHILNFLIPVQEKPTLFSRAYPQESCSITCSFLNNSYHTLVKHKEKAHPENRMTLVRTEQHCTWLATRVGSRMEVPVEPPTGETWSHAETRSLPTLVLHLHLPDLLPLPLSRMPIPMQKSQVRVCPVPLRNNEETQMMSFQEIKVDFGFNIHGHVSIHDLTLSAFCTTVVQISWVL